MVKFRRSMKSEKPDGKTHHISIPAKDPQAIVPPKKVIKARFDYSPPSTDGYLAFSAGDFLHVVGRENDPDWYEACNPLLMTRGLVPAQYFDAVGKTVRTSGSSTTSIPQNNIPSAGHDSGYAEKPATANSIPNQTSGATPGEIDPKSMRISKSLFKGNGNNPMVYGVVMYDFKAERPDELEAKEGEAIIVVAQSNPEWFVAKPITRLGGPGLIPVSFIEIRDMVTSKPVADPQEAIRRAGVPRVEEWKKIAAEYKNGSIPLGKLESNSAQSLQQGIQRMSMGNRNTQGGPASHDQGVGYASTSNSMGPPPARTNGPPQGQQAGYRTSSPGLLAPLSATVPRYCFADDIFWFIVECQMEDGRHWELSRLYQDFYDLQINLIKEFPLEAGNVPGKDRTLPYMPGPVTYVTDNISNGRRANLDEYIKNLLKLGPHITKSDLVRKFFAPRQDDYEIEPDAIGEGFGGDENAQSQESVLNDGYGSMGNHTSMQNPYGGSYGQTTQHQRGQSVSSQAPQQHYRSQSEISHGAGMRHNSAIAQQSTGGGANAFKIKVWFDQDTCVVLRMQSGFRFPDLLKKLVERRRMETQVDQSQSDNLLVEYKDELDGQFYRIENDEDLAIAMDRNPKLTLSVSSMS